MTLKFTEANIELFMGGDFKLPERPKTVGEFKEFLRECLKELDDWGGDETPLSEVFFNRDTINVTLEKGIIR